MTTTTTAATKLCPKCGETKPMEAFNRQRSKRDGRQSRCKACEHNYYATNREKVLEGKRAHYAANKEKVLEDQRARREANPDKVRESARTTRERHAARTPDEVAARRAELRPDGRKQCRKCKEWLPFEAFSMARANADGLHSTCRTCDNTGLLKIMSLRDNWEDLSGCVYCGAPFESVDHVIPQAAGGEDIPENLAPACTSCNSSKKDRPLFMFLQQLYPDVDLGEALRVFTITVMP